MYYYGQFTILPVSVSYIMAMNNIVVLIQAKDRLNRNQKSYSSKLDVRAPCTTLKLSRNKVIYQKRIEFSI